MVDITLRSEKGTPLTHDEVDANFRNLNTGQAGTHTNVAAMVADTNASLGDTITTQGYTTANDGGGASYIVVANGTGTDDGGLFHDLDNSLQAQLITVGVLNLRQFGWSVSTTDTQNSIIMANGISASEDGGTVIVPADDSGQYLFTSFTINKPLTLQGEGWRMDQNSAPFGAAKWFTDCKGSVLRSTLTSGTAVTIGKPGIATLQYNLKDIAIIGPGTGTSTGVLMGDTSSSSGSGSSEWSNVLLGNFSTNMKIDDINQCDFYSLRIRGCNVGLEFINSNANANSFYGFEIQACATEGVLFTVNANNNTFFGKLAQGNSSNSFSITGENNQFYGFWMENASSTGDDFKLRDGSIGTIIQGCNNLKRPIRIEGASSKKNVIRDNLANPVSVPEFKVESSVVNVNFYSWTNQNFTFVDNSNKVAAAGAQDEPFKVIASPATTPVYNSGSEMILEKNSDVFFQFVTPPGNQGGFLMGDDGGSDRGFILYNHSVDAFRFGTASAEVMRLDTDGNLLINTTTEDGGGSKVIAIANASVVPGSNPTGGGVLYVDSGALEYRGSGGKITTLAQASPSSNSETISSDAITIGSKLMITSFMVASEGAAATDDLSTINGGEEGQVIVFRSASSSQDITFKDDTDNLRIAGDFTTTRAEDTITLLKNGSLWYEVSRSDNG